MEPTLRVNAPSVVAEIIDGEAVIMDLTTGHYFSTLHVGCDIWRGIELGASRSVLVRSLMSAYGVAPEVASEAVSTFVADLLQRKLVLESSGTASGAELPAAWLTSAGQPFVAPVLSAYTDMEELLLLDPIHDVDQAGWPIPKPTDASAL